MSCLYCTSTVPDGRLHVFTETKVFFTGTHMHEHMINNCFKNTYTIESHHIIHVHHIWLQLVRLRSYQIHEMQLANCVSSIIVYTARHTLYLQFPVHFVEIGCKFANLYDEIVNLLKTVTWAAVASCACLFWLWLYLNEKYCHIYIHSISIQHQCLQHQCLSTHCIKQSYFYQLNWKKDYSKTSHTIFVETASKQTNNGTRLYIQL